MGAAEENIINTLIESMQATEKKPKAYDTGATVLRIENGTAWVRIPGGVDETPVKLTIDAKVGDVVQVRVSDGSAFLVGNATAPPTDDTTAKEVEQKVSVVTKVVETVKKVAETAARIAGNTNQYFWHTETGTDTGVHITEIPQAEFLADPSNGGGNLLARSNGIAVRDGLAEIAIFSADGTDLNSSDGYVIAHLGYGTCHNSGGDIRGLFFSLGPRNSSATIGQWSTAEGKATAASGSGSHSEGESTFAEGDNSHAEGYFSVASGARSHAQNGNTVAAYADQTAIGKFNDNQSTTAFEIGNGAVGSRSNALTVDWSGNVVAAGDITDGNGVSLSALYGAVISTYKQVVSSSTTISAASATSTITVACDAISGYTPILATPRNAGSNVAHFRTLYLDGTDIKLIIGNASASSTTISSAYVNVLYVKDELVGNPSRSISAVQNGSVLSIS